MGRTLDELRQERGADPIETALDLLLESHLDVTMVLHYAGEKAVREIAAHPCSSSARTASSARTRTRVSGGRRRGSSGDTRSETASCPSTRPSRGSRPARLLASPTGGGSHPGSAPTSSCSTRSASSTRPRTTTRAAPCGVVGVGRGRAGVASRRADRRASGRRRQAVARSSRRSSPRRILPVTVIGSSSTNATARGYSYAARRSRTNACSSRASSSPRPPPGPPRRTPSRSRRARVGCADHGRQRDRGMADEAPSISPGPMRYPELVITSSSLPTKRR